MHYGHDVVHQTRPSIGGASFEVGGIEFVPNWMRPSRPGSLTLVKNEDMVAAYRDLLAPFDRPNVIEIGIAQGGSVALLALLAEPARLVALELADTPVDALAATLHEHGLAERVSTHYGVDQSDRRRVREIVDGEFGPAAALDVVIDDASHEYLPTLASFELLFPRLRPGGIYVIEDWRYHHELHGGLDAMRRAGSFALTAETSEIAERYLGDEPAQRPLSLLALQAIVARATSSDAISAVTVDESWIVLHRGEGTLDRDTFRLTDAIDDVFRLLPIPPRQQAG